MTTAGIQSTGSSWARYNYSPLPTTSSFRVLELLPGAPDDEIHIRLHHVSWNEPPSYEAISYAWGDTSIKVQITCDGSMLDITPNLRDGLRQMRFLDQPRYLWADAICIDHENTAEKGHLVSNMLRIYRNATLVLVWLGVDETGQAELVSQIINILTEVACLRIGMAAPDLKAVDDLIGLVPESLDDLAPSNDQIIPLLHGFFSKAWFRRLWVYQEVNSGTEVIVMCGSARLSWDAVAFVANLFLSCKRPHSLFNMHIRGSPFPR